MSGFSVNTDDLLSLRDDLISAKKGIESLDGPNDYRDLTFGGSIEDSVIALGKRWSEKRETLKEQIDALAKALESASDMYFSVDTELAKMFIIPGPESDTAGN